MEFDNVKDDLLAIVDAGIKFGKEKDSTADYEVYLLYDNTTRAAINEGVVDAKFGELSGHAIRVAKNKKVRFVSGSGIDIKRIKESIKEALSLVKTLDVVDERFNSFISQNSKLSSKEGIFNDKILEIEDDDLIKKNLQMIKEAKGHDSRIKSVMTIATFSWDCFAVGNSLGIEASSRNLNNYTHVSSTAKDVDKKKTSSEFIISREDVIDVEGLGKKSSIKAINLLNSKKFGITKKLPTVWDHIASASYIQSSLSRSLSGVSVVEGLSPLADRIGDDIANKNFTLIDDGQDPSFLSTVAFDAEGSPKRKNTLVENGVLKSFIFDSYYGKIFGTESTSNCDRGSGIFGTTLPYETAPTIGVNTLDLKTGKLDEKALFESIDGQGVYIEDMPLGIFHTNVATGEFSIVCSDVYLIENGEKTTALDSVSVAGNFYEGFKNLRSICSNKKKTPYGVNTGFLLFDDFTVVG